ncbi:hypothetical protein AAKU67_004143, partial [Oxalobacteraceae bacterium GrIS 2.11]
EVRQLWTENGKRHNTGLAENGVLGVLKSYVLGNFTVANLVHVEDGTGSARQRLLLPTLYSPVLESLEGAGMILKGVQVIEGRMVEQHWAVRFIARIPPSQVNQ